MHITLVANPGTTNLDVGSGSRSTRATGKMTRSGGESHDCNGSRMPGMELGDRSRSAETAKEEHGNGDGDGGAERERQRQNRAFVEKKKEKGREPRGEKGWGAGK